MFSTAQAAQAQWTYCGEHKLPCFAIALCPHCGRNIYQEYERDGHKTGISVEQAGSDLITGCPHCHYSFVE